MLLYLAQGAAVTGGWNVTTVIALVGAVISLATLGVTTVATGRRERAKWARESLAEAFYEFVDATFRSRDRAYDLQVVSLAPEGSKVLTPKQRIAMT